MLDIKRHSAAGRVEQVLVHADQAGNHRVIRQVQAARGVGDSHLAAGSDGFNTPTVDHNRLILERRRAGAVNDAHVLERYHRCVHCDEWLDSGSELALCQHHHGQKICERSKSF